MASKDKPTRLPSPPGRRAKVASEDAPCTTAHIAPIFASPSFAAPLITSPFTTSCSAFHTMSTVSGASSHASVKQQSRAEVVARTVHLRCLPPFMKQRELADVFDECGEYLRVRICGNAATHQKWVYGFVEFATIEAGTAMIKHSGMELSNGADKPPLRLKCSPSKQPILDCVAYDADVIGGTPCGFGRGYLAECTLNDALLVVGNGGGAGSVASKVESQTSVVISGIASCACGSAGANCCGCCPCRKGVKVPEGSPNELAAPELACSEHVAPVAVSTKTVVSHPSRPATAPLLYPVSEYTSFTHLVSVPAVGNMEELDVLQQLAAAFQGLQSSAATAEGQLDGPAIVRKAETMTLDALNRASHLSSDTRIQDILCDLAQLLSFLDSHAAVTGGAAQTASGDCTATLPQRVTQLRMLANLVGALLCLLRRSVADAVPYVEAVLVTFAQIPPSSLLLRERQQDKCTSSAAATAAPSVEATSPKGRIPAGEVLSAGVKQSKKASSTRREHLLYLSCGAFVDETVTDALLDLIDEGEDGAELKEEINANDLSCGAACEAGDCPLKCRTKDPFYSRPPRRSSSASSLSSDGSVAYLNTADMADLLRQDTYFTGYSLNVLVSIGLAMEETQPTLARGVYTLANKRAVEVFGYPNRVLVKCLAATSSGNPHLREELFEDTGKDSSGRDITFFPRRFFESVRATWVRVRDTRGTDGFYRLLPPNYAVALFQT